MFELELKDIKSRPHRYIDFLLPGILAYMLMNLCIGFFLGSLAKTQEAIQPIALLFTFPQLILSGIFFPISSLPVILQPLAHALPLSVIANAIRTIANDGVNLVGLNLNFLGILIWMLISFVFATKFFDWHKVNS